jgi:hypothetical protein
MGESSNLASTRPPTKGNVRGFESGELGCWSKLGLMQPFFSDGRKQFWQLPQRDLRVPFPRIFGRRKPGGLLSLFPADGDKTPEENLISPPLPRRTKMCTSQRMVARHSDLFTSASAVV